MAWNCLCLMLLVTSHTVDSFPSISGVAKSVTFRNTGDNITVPCKDSEAVEWYYQKPGYDKKAKKSRNADRSGDQVILTLKNVSCRQSGRYTCSNTLTKANASFYLFVKDLSKPFCYPMPYYDVKEGSDASGLCLLSNPHVTGYAINRCGQPDLPKGFTYRKDIENGVTIRNVQTEFNGCYYCSVHQSGIVRRTNDFRLLVSPVQKKPPEIFVTKSRLLVKTGEPFEVTCVVKDVNPAEVRWVNAPLMTITETSQFQGHSSFVRNSTLSSKAVRLNDSGTYVCQAKNVVHAVNATFTLDVIETGYISLNVTENTTLDVTAGESRVLRVYIDAYPRPDELTWTYMNGTLVNTSGHFAESRDKGNNRFISELHLMRLKGTEKGTYTFYASNSDANSSVSFNINVKTKPEILIAERVSNDMLHCVASGFPLPSIDWYFCPGCDQRCTGLPPSDTKYSQENSSLGRALVESYLDVSSIEKNGTVQCIASNGVDSATSHFTLAIAVPLSNSTTEKSHTLFTPPLIGFSVAAGVMCVAVTVLVYKYIQKPKYEVQWQVVEEISGNNYAFVDPTQLPYDYKWEFPRGRLQFGKILGAGAFGRVVEATAYGLLNEDNAVTVAVKMLKPSAHTTEREALMSELKVLSYLGHHQNIVNLLGACTLGGPTLVITEYCCYGDLMNYLRRKRSSFIWPTLVDHSGAALSENLPNSRGQVCDGASEYMDMNPEAIYVLPEQKEPGSYVNQDVTNAVPEEDDSAIDTEDLIRFSYQVAQGMTFLASKNCIHRDLAARNVLLTHGRITKICDFGLARNIENDSNYVVKGNARLPLKWMAPESIFDCVYTFESDVWSYGILLWEIFSLGSSPYPGIPMDSRFYRMIEEGYRMPSPECAPPELYEIMKSCWHSEPQGRPVFAQIVQMVGQQLPDSRENTFPSGSPVCPNRAPACHSASVNSGGSSTPPTQPLPTHQDQ